MIFLRRIAALFSRSSMDRDMDLEMRAHLERETEQNIARGLSPDEARSAARRAFGGLDQVKERERDARGWRWLEDLARDFRHAVRQLTRSPGFTAVAVLTLALGIGANSAIFSVVHAVVLQPLPYAQSDHLVRIWVRFTGIGLTNDLNRISVPELNDLETQARCFSHVAAVRSGASFNLNQGDLPQRIEGAYVTPSLFPLLGVQPALGRAFLPTEAEPGQDSVVVLSHGLWQNGFGGDPDVVGQRLNINGQSREVLGVMPSGFESFGAELWVPLVLGPEDLRQRGNHSLGVLGRVKPELTLEQAAADLQVLSQAVVDQNPDYPYERFNFRFIMVPLLDSIVGDVQRPLWILFGAVALVLLIACANVANLLMVRASAREREVAVRLALGAGRGRLCRQWLVESLLLAVLGGLAGLLVAHGGLKLLLHWSSTILPRVTEATLDSRVMGFTMLVTLGTGVIFGLAPALHTTQGSGARALRRSDRSVTSGLISQRLRHALIVAEIALSLVLLSGAGVLVKSLTRVLAVESGFRPENVLTMRVSLPEAGYAEPPRARAFYDELLGRISRLPGVETVGATSTLPLTGGGNSGDIVIDSHAVSPDRTTPEADRCVVTPGYFQAMGITVLSGRAFDARDTNDSEPVVVVDDTLAQAYWPGESAVGQRLRLPGDDSPWLKIVGVVRHVRSRTLEAPSRIQVYWPESQRTRRSLTLAIRTAVPPPSLVASVRREIAALDPEQPAYDIRTMEEWLQDSLALRRFGTQLLAVFAALAVVLAAVGIYGVMAYWVGRRTNEIGIRMAVGAQSTQVVGLILRKGVHMAAFGGGLGLLGTLATNRVLGSLLFQVEPTDPATLVLGPLTIGAVALLACWLPARRAAKIDPIKALRAE